jgi:tetratricopeptide (TPR) repeat protein
MAALVVWTTGLSPALAQDGKGAGGERERAVELIRDHRALEALPLLEKIAKDHPEDRAIQEGLAEALVSKSAIVAEEEASAILLRVRQILLKLKETGEMSPLSQIYLDQIPPDGKLPPISRDKEVARALREAEAAFARHDFAKARDGYGRALALDPKHYQAMLFTGDTYFAEKQPGRAVVWFAKAAALDPDKAVAFRYWGDALRDLGKVNEARERYLDAIVAEPYTRAPWLSLADWGKRNGVALSHPRVLPEPTEPTGQPDGTAYLPAYKATRDAWSKAKFKAEYPKAPAYRHTLREESEALRAVLEPARRDRDSGKIKALHPNLEALDALDREGLLDAYILLARPDDGIAEDYMPYRAAHRDALKRYLGRYVAPIKPVGDDAPKTAAR